MEALTYYALIALLILAVALQLLRAWCEHKDHQWRDEDEHEETDQCRN